MKRGAVLGVSPLKPFTNGPEVATLRDILLIALGGGLGAVSRYGAGVWAGAAFGVRFPYGTLIVNVAGCFLLGLLMHVSLATNLVSPATRAALGIGLLGGLTTFSTFGYETFVRLEAADWAAAATNVLANVVLGLFAVWLGIVAARLLVGGV